MRLWRINIVQDDFPGGNRPVYFSSKREAEKACKEERLTVINDYLNIDQDIEIECDPKPERLKRAKELANFQVSDPELIIIPETKKLMIDYLNNPFSMML